MWTGNPTKFSTTMQFTKSDQLSKEKEHLKGFKHKEIQSSKANSFDPPKKKGFVRLDSLEDYEIIDLDMVKDQTNVKLNSKYTNQSHQDNNPMGFFDCRHYHPAANAPPPYMHSNRNVRMNFKAPQEPNNYSDIAREATKFTNQYIPWHISDHLSGSQQYHYNPLGLDASLDSIPNFPANGPFSDIRKDITHHVPYNLTKGHYEHWMSVPGGGRANSHFEAMQAYSHNHIATNRYSTRHIPAQISKTVSSWVGGICDWVTSSVDSALKPNGPPSQNITQQISERSNLSSLVKPLNPDAKVFTPQVTLNPNAKEFLPSKMTATAESGIIESSSIPAPSNDIQAAITQTSIRTDYFSKMPDTYKQSNHLPSETSDIVDVLNQSDPELSQIVIEKLIQETNKEKQMEKYTFGEKNIVENENTGSLLSPNIDKETDKVQLKSIAARKTTPWINLRKNLGAISRLGASKIDCNATPLNQVVDDSTDITLSGGSQSDSDDSDDDFEDDFSPRSGIDSLSRIRKISRKQSASSSCDDFEIEFDGSRQRSLSVCSDESNFIEFGTSPTKEQVIAECDNSSPNRRSSNQANKTFHSRINNGEKPKRCLLQTFVVHAKAYAQNMEQDRKQDQDTDEESDSNDDPDWDEVDGEDDVVDDPLWQSFKTRVLVCPMSTKEPNKSSCNTNNFKENSNISPTIGIISIDSIFLQNPCDSILDAENGCNRNTKSPKEINDANERWDSFYNDSVVEDTIVSDRQSNASIEANEQSVPGRKSNSKFSVSIAPADSFVVIFEDPNESADLRESRNGDYSCDNLARRKADKERMERLMAPVFQSEHRRNMWERIQSGAYCVSPKMI